MKLHSTDQKTRQLAHDLLSPLASLSLLLNQEQNMGDEERIIANQALHRKQLLVEQLLECPEASRNPTPPTKAVALAPLLKAVVREQEFALKNVGNKSLKLNLPDLPFTVRCHVQPLVFECVVANLIANAFEATTGRPGEVWISLTCHASRAVVTITDNGPGISDLVLKHYEKGIPYSTKKGGHGLGLLSARSIALGWKGFLRITSQPHGTSIALELPLSKKGISK
ncbi:MAG: ATP-binding protein [Bdellovibrionota bacterium]